MYLAISHVTANPNHHVTQMQPQTASHHETATTTVTLRQLKNNKTNHSALKHHNKPLSQRT
jgi:hypothetical protein